MGFVLESLLFGSLFAQSSGFFKAPAVYQIKHRFSGRCIMTPSTTATSRKLLLKPCDTTDNFLFIIRTYDCLSRIQSKLDGSVFTNNYWTEAQPWTGSVIHWYKFAPADAPYYFVINIGEPHQRLFGTDNTLSTNEIDGTIRQHWEFILVDECVHFTESRNRVMLQSYNTTNNVATASACGQICLEDKDCLSIEHNNLNQTCRLSAAHPATSAPNTTVDFATDASKTERTVYVM